MASASRKWIHPESDVRPDVSVIVTTYNHRLYIEEALESVLAQEGPSFELIITEDFSEDGTREILEEFAARYGFVQLLLSERNRNDHEVYLRAHRRARGRYLALLDGDDHWLPGKLSAQVEALNAQPSFSACFHAVRVLGNPEESARTFDEPYADLERLYRGNVVCAPSIMYRRQSVESIPDWFDQSPFGDWPLHLIAAEQGPVLYLDRELAVYRWHQGGVWSGSSLEQQARWNLEMLLLMREQGGPSHRRLALPAIAAARLRLGELAEQLGDRKGMVSAAVKAFPAAARSTDGLVAGRSSRMFIRAVLPAAYGRLRQRLRG